MFVLSNSAGPLGGHIGKGQISKEEEEWTPILGHEVTLLSQKLNQQTPSGKLKVPQEQTPIMHIFVSPETNCSLQRKCRVFYSVKIKNLNSFLHHYCPNWA
jgi:hypothetical protein